MQNNNVKAFFYGNFQKKNYKNDLEKYRFM